MTKQELIELERLTKQALRALGYEPTKVNIFNSGTLLVSHDVEKVSQVQIVSGKIYIVTNKMEIKEFTYNDNGLISLKTYVVPFDRMAIQTAIEALIIVNGLGE